MNDVLDRIGQATAAEQRRIMELLVDQLADSGHLLWQLLLAMPGSCILFSIDGRVRAASPRMLEFFLQRQDVKGLHYTELSFPVFKDCSADVLICDLIRSTLEDGLEYENVLLDRPAAEGSLCMELSLRLLRGADGKPQALLLQCVEDVVQFNFLRHQQLRGQKLEKLGALSAGMVHEIKNPLQAVSSIIQILERRYKDDEYLQTKLGTMYDELQRLDVILREFLSFAAQKPDNMEAVDPNLLCAEVVSIVEGSCRLENIELKLDLTPDMPLLVLDAGKIKQVLINLLVNAIDALKQRAQDESDFLPVIEFTSRYDFALDECVIEIRDNGCGITPEVLKALEQPFFTTKRHGTGLGVSLSRSIAEEHGGRLELFSPEGCGTVARLSLPELAGLLALTESSTKGRELQQKMEEHFDVLTADWEALIAGKGK